MIILQQLRNLQGKKWIFPKKNLQAIYNARTIFSIFLIFELTFRLYTNGHPFLLFDFPIEILFYFQFRLVRMIFIYLRFVIIANAVLLFYSLIFWQSFWWLACRKRFYGNGFQKIEYFEGDFKIR
jgi:hypothetical protein